MKGENLRKAREGLGLTQAQLAEELGIQPNTVARYERDLLVIPKAIELAIEALQTRNASKPL
jgi:transcriptional regulator with XRE-family HTH domain